MATGLRLADQSLKVAVDGNDRLGDAIAERGAQEQNEIRDLVRLDEGPERCLSFPLCRYLLEWNTPFVGQILHDTVEPRTCHPARADRVHPYAVRSELGGPGLRQTE